MKIQTDKQSLQKGTSRLHGTVVERSLAHIGLKSRGNQLTLSSSDLVLSAFCYVPCETMQEGELFIPAKLFSEVVRELPEGVVYLEVEGNSLVVSAGLDEQFKMKIPLINDIPWQDKPRINFKETSPFSAVDLAYMISQTQFCVSQDSPRNFGTVAYLHHAEKQEWRIIGSDGFRLSYCQAHQERVSPNFLEEGICLTKRTVNELEKMCREGHESITLSVAEDRSVLLAEIADFQLFMRLSSVKYPNYKMVIQPSQKSYEVVLERKALLDGVRRIMLAADKSKSIRLQFTPGLLEIASRNLGSSEGREHIPLGDFSGELALSINGKYLLDVVSTSGSDQLMLRFSNEDAPMIILPQEEPKGCQSLHLFLPIKESSRS